MIIKWYCNLFWFHIFLKTLMVLNLHFCIQPGKTCGDPAITSVINNIRALKYYPNWKVFYKVSHEDKWAKILSRLRPDAELRSFLLLQWKTSHHCHQQRKIWWLDGIESITHAGQFKTTRIITSWQERRRCLIAFSSTGNSSKSNRSYVFIVSMQRTFGYCMFESPVWKHCIEFREYWLMFSCNFEHFLWY